MEEGEISEKRSVSTSFITLCLSKGVVSSGKEEIARVIYGRINTKESGSFTSSKVELRVGLPTTFVYVVSVGDTEECIRDKFA